jgi:hypothetical protein
MKAPPPFVLVCALLAPLGAAANELLATPLLTVLITPEDDSAPKNAFFLVVPPLPVPLEAAQVFIETLRKNPPSLAVQVVFPPDAPVETDFPEAENPLVLDKTEEYGHSSTVYFNEISNPAMITVYHGGMEAESSENILRVLYVSPPGPQGIINGNAFESDTWSRLLQDYIFPFALQEPDGDNRILIMTKNRTFSLPEKKAALFLIALVSLLFWIIALVTLKRAKRLPAKPPAEVPPHTF